MCLFSSSIEPCAFSCDFKMDRITVFLLHLIIVVIGCANSENVATPYSTSYGKFIYQASIQNSLNRHICNGVILNRNFILTLGQCISNYSNAGELKVFYGSNRLNHNGSYVDVKQIYIHPGFNITIIRNDIALLLTATDITFIANVSGSINLPEHDVPINQQLTAIGWIVSVSKYEIFNWIVYYMWIWFQATNDSDWLQHRNLETISPLECRKLNPLLNHIIRTWLICSIDPINRVNICRNDDLGSALVAEDNTLYGIRTMNEETCSKTSLNIYTNVFAQIEWIRFITTGWPWWKWAESYNSQAYNRLRKSKYFYWIMKNNVIFRHNWFDTRMNEKKR